MSDLEWDDEEHGVRVGRARSARGFIDALRRSNNIWWDDGRMPWAFRGHASKAWSLSPSAWRSGNSIISAAQEETQRRFDTAKPSQQLCWFFGNFCTGAASFGARDQVLGRRLVIETTAELLPIYDFLLACNEGRHSIPLVSLPPDPFDQPDWLQNPAYPLGADELLRFYDLSAAIALAQHHGIPTRLLDWTIDPIAAAYFAVEDIVPIPDDDVVVWCLHRERIVKVKTEGVKFPNAEGFPEVSPQVVIVRPPIRDNPYLAAQSGLFTSISAAGIFFMQNDGSRPALEDFVAQARPPETVLMKLVISHDHVPELREILRRERVSRATLMPTLDNIAKDVGDKWRARRTA